MGKIEVQLYDDKYIYHGPSNWDELKRGDLLAWAEILRRELTKDEALLSACILFYKIPKHLFTRLSPVYKLLLAEHMDWLVDNKLTANVIGKFRLFFRVYYGPGNRLANLTIAEYRNTELFYDLYLKTGLKKYLYFLAAVLFRPKGKGISNDVRKEMNEVDVMQRAKLFTWALHPNILKAIQLQYEGCRAYIRQSFPMVYPKPVQQNEMNPFAPRVDKQQIHDLDDVILAFSGDKLGVYADVQQANLYVFLKYMNQRIAEAQGRKNK